MYYISPLEGRVKTPLKEIPILKSKITKSQTKDANEDSVVIAKLRHDLKQSQGGWDTTFGLTS